MDLTYPLRFHYDILMASKAIPLVGVVAPPLSAEDQATLAAEVAAGRIFMVEAPDGSGRTTPYVPYGVACAIPYTFAYDGSGPFDWSMTVQVTEGRPRCVELRFKATMNRYLLAQSLRDFPFGAMLEEAVMMTAVELDADGRPGKLIGRGESKEAAAKFLARVEREHRRQSRGQRRAGRVTPETLRRTAEIYVANLASGRPVEAVAADLRVSRATAGRYVGRSRDAGFLSAADGRGRAGGGLRNPKSTEGSGDV